MKKNCLIFDFDGVLIESESQSLKLISKVLKKKHSISIGKEMANKKIGKATLSFLKEYFSNQLSNEEINRVYAEYKQESFQNIEKYLSPHDEVIRFIKNNYKKYDIAIASMNSKKFIESILSILNISECIKAIITREDVINQKPNPEIYLKTLKVMNSNQKNALVIEDSPKGIEAANKAGIDCIGVINNHNKNVDFKKVKVNKFINVEDFNSKLENFLKHNLI